MDNPFKYKQFQGEIILFCVRWYCQTALSYQNLADMMAERGCPMDKTTIWRWVQQYAQEIRKRSIPYLRTTYKTWHVDETVIKIKGKLNYFYRAIDCTGDTIDFMLSAKKDIHSACRFFKRSLTMNHVKIPGKIVTDKNKAYAPAISDLKSTGVLPKHCQHVMDKHSNDYLESDHRFTKRKVKYSMWFQSFDSAQNTLSGYEAMHMLRKGQVRHVGLDAVSQMKFVHRIFGLVA